MVLAIIPVFETVLVYYTKDVIVKVIIEFIIMINIDKRVGANWSKNMSFCSVWHALYNASIFSTFVKLSTFVRLSEQ